MVVARDKFGILPSEDPGTGSDTRLAALEEKLKFLQGGLEELLALHKEGPGYVTAKEDGGKGPPLSKAKMTPASAAGTKAKPKSSARASPVVPPPPALAHVQFPGLDPGAVNSALQAGVQVTMTKVLSTDIVAHLSSSKKKPDSLEEVLEFSGGASGSADSMSGAGRKHAAVIRTLKRLFKEDPKQLWTSIESNIAEEFSLQTGMPNAPQIPFAARGWAEHRSKIQGNARTVRSTWAVSGILDALRGGAIDEARCRCIYLAQMEQESLDHGPFLLA